ncbi:HAMP domain-containing histidine kinase [Haematospirillum sp. 15-248]|uniref:sensor histidine kinase n=1 Tax=Haematospirillum sp. 15-248 TaxID=2723107 RepID=UPI00143C95FE|nr:HAMP domain-containing sensor histidine kinase [Haematospirillum sp. 15-248]NKD87695.1 HAMP domain-containing histidine kinase [Haematospirillum sp. 15-248]
MTKTPAQNRNPSLRVRLLVGAALWVSMALAIAGFGLQALFENFVQGQMVSRLSVILDHIAANIDIGADGQITLLSRPANPLFQRPLSGLYWQVEYGNKVILRSRSLWDEQMELPYAASPLDGSIQVEYAGGPGQSKILAVTRFITLPETHRLFRIVAGTDERSLERLFTRFCRIITIALGLLAIGITAAVWGQITFGLAPFRHLRQSLADIRSGKNNTLEGRWPIEVVPLVEDLNALLLHHDKMVKNARTHAGNLAHALKTPLAVIMNESDQLDKRGQHQAARLLKQQTETMQRHIEHHLARARAQTSTKTRGLRTAPEPSIERLCRTMRHLHKTDIKVNLDEHCPSFCGNQETLEEIIGNLLDNACKWSRGQVVVQAGSNVDGELWISVDDDGPGIPDSHIDAALHRGHRLDESKPGSGLGLSIADDLARTAGGSLHLGRSAILGGLMAHVTLPASNTTCRQQTERVYSAAEPVEAASSLSGIR